MDERKANSNYLELVLKYYELRTRQHKVLNINVLRPSSFEALFTLGYNDLRKKVMKDVPSSSWYAIMKDKAYET
jgi:hypothetical protein